MNGVEILSVQEVVTETTSNWWLAGFVWLGVIVFGGIIGFWISRQGEVVIAGCLVAALLGIFAFAGVVVATNKPVEYETHYKVTIDDSVSMNEFLDKYEIIDQEGKIYTVKERE